MSAFKPQYARNFDFFRVAHALEKIGVSKVTLRKWSKLDGGPNIYRMKKDKMSWVKFSEVEQYIAMNSEILK